MATLHDIKSNSAYADLCTLTHTHTSHLYVFLIAKILSIPDTMHSLIQGLLHGDTRMEWTLTSEEQRGYNDIYTGEEGKVKQRKPPIHGTNIEIWRGCCNQSLESSAFMPNWMLN